MEMNGVSHLVHGPGAPHLALVRRNVVQNAVYDMYINFGLGVQGHQGMGLVGLCLWGWKELAIWMSDQGQPNFWHCMCAKVWCKTPAMLRTINFGFGVQGHLGMGLASWFLWGWMELFFCSRDLGQPKHVCQSVVQNAAYIVDINWFGGPWAHWDVACEVVLVGMDGVCHLEQGPGAFNNMCAKVWFKMTPFMIGTSTLVKGS